MRDLLKLSVLETNLWKAFARSFASEPLVQCNDGAERNSTLGQRWQQHESQVLLAGLRKQELELEKAGRWNAEQSRKERWEQIESFCHSKGIYRSAEQCRQRWQRLLHAYFKVKSWESSIPPGKTSFWSMKASERKAAGLPFSLDWKTFSAINDIQGRKDFWLTTAGFSSAGGVSTESPSANGQSETDDYETQQCTKAHDHPEIDDFQMQQCTEESITLINSDQDMQSSKSSSTSVGCTQQKQNLHDDSRPVVLVKFINQCLVDLEGLEYDCSDQTQAQVQMEKGTINDCGGPTEDLFVTADANAPESMKNKISAEGQRAKKTEL